MCPHYVFSLYLPTRSLQTMAIEYLGIFISFEPLHNKWNPRLKFTFTTKILCCKYFRQYLSIYISWDTFISFLPANKRYKAVEKIHYIVISSITSISHCSKSRTIEWGQRCFKQQLRHREGFPATPVTAICCEVWSMPWITSWGISLQYYYYSICMPDYYSVAKILLIFVVYSIVYV